MPRRKRRPGVTKGPDGYYHAYVTVGIRPNGRPRQLHISRSTLEECEDAIDAALEDVKNDTLLTRDDRPTVQQLLDSYYRTTAPRRCKPNTIRDYQSLTNTWIVPHVGGIKAEALTADHLEQIYLKMEDKGLAGSSQLKLHRIMSRAWEVARRKKLVRSNITADIDAPSAGKVRIEPLTEEAARKIITVTADEWNGARWSVALALGLRQGERLGLRWSHLDLEQGEMRAWWQIQRRTYQHGCTPACGRKRGADCPERWLQIGAGEEHVAGGLVLTRRKGDEELTVPVPPPLVAVLKRHRATQYAARQRAGNVWVEHGLVFTTRLGGPLPPEEDARDWKDLLGRLGIPAARLHDGRHTAASLLIAQGVDIATVREILGHTDIRTTQRYVHVTSAIARDATERIGRALWEKPVTRKRQRKT